MPSIFRAPRPRCQPRLRAQPLALLAGLALLAVACSGTGAEPRRVAGTNATLPVPRGLLPARTYSGFEDARGTVSLRVSELHQPMHAAQRFAATELAARLGPALRSQEELVLGGRPACLLLVEQPDSAVTYADWQLMIFGEHDTLDVRGRFPRAEARRWSEPLRQALLGLDWQPGARAAVFEGPGFRIRPPEGYAHATSAQGVYGFESGPAEGAAARRAFLDPSLSVVLQAGDLTPEELEGEALRRLEGRPGTTDWELIQSTGFQLAGAPAREVLARARLSQEQEPFFLVGVLLADGGVLWWLHGEARLELEPVELPRLRASLMSFERVRTASGAASD